MGEQLESLTLRELQQLEHQIDSALRNIRSRKVQVTTHKSHANAECTCLFSPTTSVLAVTFYFGYQLYFRTTPCSTRSRSSKRRQVPNKAITPFHLSGKKTFFTQYVKFHLIFILVILECFFFLRGRCGSNKKLVFTTSCRKGFWLNKIIFLRR
jgi:hypothetical protein